MPIISVVIGEGRSSEKKRGLIKALTTAAVDSFDVRPDQVRVILNEVPLDHYAVAGTTFAERAEADSAGSQVAKANGVVS
jgi:4-oxalocrotonate tautomerase